MVKASKGQVPVKGAGQDPADRLCRRQGAAL